MRDDDLLPRLRQLAGSDAVFSDLESRQFFSTDLSWRPFETVSAVVRPADIDALANVVSAATQAGFAIVARGGGMSYTNGYTPSLANSISIDMRGMDRIVEINTDDLYGERAKPGAGDQAERLLGLPAMETAPNPIEIYQFRVVLRDTSPHIWRRFLVRSDSSLLDLHQIIQIAFGWSGRQVFEFGVQGHRQEGVRLDSDTRDLLLADFRLYVKECFTYAYNLADQESRPWRFELRLEQKVAIDARQYYPRCIGGVGAAPPELCGGPIAFESFRDLFTPEYITWRTEEMRVEGWTAAHDEALRHLQLWIHRKLDRRGVNQQLRQGGTLTRKESPQS